ncbi:Hypothetical_protein [Hexamita inflata]|uniref:Hypothetical_protein n=1 Tax=Hexamita inflata TaxID=28002 RepID=A0AA86U0G0_9EUKA|nr:Hypothetical protein HINF_LOCUS23189 [Hexamita inflata]
MQPLTLRIWAVCILTGSVFESMCYFVHTLSERVASQRFTPLFMSSMQHVIREGAFLSKAAEVLQSVDHSGSSSSDTAVYQIMMLRDGEYQQFWETMHGQSGVPSSELQQYFSTVVVPRHLVKNETRPDDSHVASSSQEDTKQKFRKSVSRQKTSASDQFRELFAASLKENLSRCTFESHDGLGHAQLCVKVNAYLEHNDKVAFWRAMVVPGKTSKQVQDYYLHSFQVAIYPRQLSTADKQLLRLLSEQMASQRPSKVALEFLSRAAYQDYFKHNILMYIINLRRQSQ